MEKKTANYISKGLYVGPYRFLNGFLGFALEQMSVDILKLCACMFSIDKGSVKKLVKHWNVLTVDTVVTVLFCA